MKEFLVERNKINLLFDPKTQNCLANVQLDNFFILPGSFNPIHKGHRTLADASLYPTGSNIIYEMSIFNADKPPISADKIIERLKEFQAED